MSQASFELLSTAESGRWRETLEEIGEYDIYHLPEFHRLPEMRGEGEALLLVYREGGRVAALPVIMRDIKLPRDLGAPVLRDVTSVGGFAGPLVSPKSDVTEIREGFQHALNEFFAEAGVITAYHRLNPIIGNFDLFEGLGETVILGITVAVDLSYSPEEQLSRYNHGHLDAVKRLKNRGATCERVGPEYLDDFTQVYHETMTRAGAQPEYFFKRDYFEYLLNSMPGVTQLFICNYDGKVISAGIFSKTANIVEGMYAGGLTEYLKLSPIKILNDAVREWANELGAKWFHIGGNGSGARDSQHIFRKGFGGTELPYATWRYIADCGVYGELCAELRRRAGVDSPGGFFPEYRDPSLAPVREAVK